MSQPRVLANMVVGSNGATSLLGDSKRLSPPEDRQRFHEIRKLATAIVIGGATYRCDHYSRSPVPIVVATRDSELLKGRNSSDSSLAIFFNAPPEQVVSMALEKFGDPVLIEGGVSFINPLLDRKVIDCLYLTRSPIAGDNNYLDFSTLQNNYNLVNSTNINDVIFEEWKPRAH